MDYPHSLPDVYLHEGKFTDGTDDGVVPPSRDPAKTQNDIIDSILQVQTWTGEAHAEDDVTQLARGIVAKVSEMIAAGLSGISTKQKSIVVTGATFAAGVADGNPVRWDAVNNRWAKALADGTAADLGLGVADVTNAEVVLCGETRAGLLSGLTAGVRYYLTSAGALSTTSAADGVMVGIAKSATVLFVDFDPAPAVLTGQCRLIAATTTELALRPYNGNKLPINGVMCTIPAAGVSLSVTGLTANTTYYIYAYMAGATMTLEASATGHSTDAGTGVEIKTGDASRTLVGMARPIAGPVWRDNPAQRFVISWFNRRNIPVVSSLTSNHTTTTTTYVEIGSEGRQEFLTWADEAVSIGAQGAASINNNNYATYTSVGVDMTSTPADACCATSAYTTGLENGVAIGNLTLSLTEGYHYATLIGRVTNAAGTGTWYGSASAGARTTLQTTIRG